MTTILAGGILLGVLVFVHELGHFIVAKMSGVRVLTFSLGFGPRLFGFKKGDTDYRISAIPLGGYVRMYGDDITEEVPEEERDKSFLHKPTLQKSAIAFAGPAANFILPVFLFFFLFVGNETVNGTLVGTVVEGEPAAEAGMQVGDRIKAVAGEPVESFSDVQALIEERPGQEVPVVIERDGKQVALTVTPRGTPSLSPLEKGKQLGRVGIMPHVQRPFVTVAPGSPAAEAGLKTLDLVESVDGVKVESREQLLAALDNKAGQPVTLTVVEQPLAAKEGETPAKKTVTLSSGGVVEEPKEVEGEAGVVEGEPDVAAVPSPAPPAPYYVLASDIDRFAVTADDMKQPDVARKLQSTQRLLAQKAQANARRFGLSSYEGTFKVVQDDTPAKRLGVEEGDLAAVVDGSEVHVGSEVSVRLLGRPDEVHVIGLLDKSGQARVLAFRLEAEKERGREDFKTFGAFPGGGTWTEGELLTRDVGVVEAFKRGVTETGKMIAMTAKSLWMLATLQVSFSSLGGPITIVDLAGQAAERGTKSFITLMAFISVNLGIVNLLPVPVLDGGHLLMFGIEAVSRQRISPKTRERAVKVGFAMLMCLVVVALFNDVLRLIL